MKAQSCRSISLKINKASVMLYRNEYVKARDGVPGVTAQYYAASFSTRESVMPERFDKVLRELTAGSPNRYHELCSRIEQKVLLPRRAELANLGRMKRKSAALLDLEQAVNGIRRFESAMSSGELESDLDAKSKVAELAYVAANLAQTYHSDVPLSSTLGTRISDMLAATKIVRDMLADVPAGRALELTDQQSSDWRMTYFAFSQAREFAGGHREIAAKKNWATNDWADEAIFRGFADSDKVSKARVNTSSSAATSDRPVRHSRRGGAKPGE